MKSIKIAKYVFLIAFFCLITNCTTSASELISTEEWDYRVIDGYAYIEAYNGEETELVIPAKIDGISVDGIENYAFTGRNFTSIEISDGITKIGEGAFSYCLELKYIKIPESVNNIPYKSHFGFSSFYSCFSLENIDVDSNNSVYRSEDGVLYNKTGLMIYPNGKEETTLNE